MRPCESDGDETELDGDAVVGFMLDEPSVGANEPVDFFPECFFGAYLIVPEGGRGRGLMMEDGGLIPDGWRGLR